MPSNQNNCQNCGCTPNPLDSGNWASESTAGRSALTSSNTEPADGSLSLSPGPECKIGFKDHNVGTCWIEITYDAGANLVDGVTCKAEDITWSISGSNEGAKIDQKGVVTFGAKGELITVHVKCGEVSDSMALLCLQIKTETHAKVPSPRSRKTIGVCEKVNVSFYPLTGTATWKLEGNGTLTPAGYLAEFWAFDLKSEATVFLTLVAKEGAISATCSVKFNVIPPDGLEMVNFPGKPEYHEMGLPSAGFCAKIYVLPRTVCFSGISCIETGCFSVAIGYFESENGSWHPTGLDWIAVEEGTEANPSIVASGDSVGVQGRHEWPLRYGWIEDKLKWFYQKNGSGNQASGMITTVSQLSVANAEGGMRITKAGNSVFKELNEASSGKFRSCE